MTGKFAGKVALVTGGSNGIGRATAVALGERGAKVYVADIDKVSGEKTVQFVKDCGGDADFVQTDVSNEEQVKALIDTIITNEAHLDYAFNNAGIEGASAFTPDCTIENFDRVIAINLRGVWLCMKYEIPEMLKAGGSIVNMASIAGLVGFQGSPAYVASKHGVIGLTKTAALEYAKQNIRVNAVCPGVIDTPMIERFAGGDSQRHAALENMHPIGRIGRPEEVAAAVVWLCSDEASFVTGIHLPIDGGHVAQ